MGSSLITANMQLVVLLPTRCLLMASRSCTFWGVSHNKGPVVWFSPASVRLHNCWLWRSCTLEGRFGHHGHASPQRRSQFRCQKDWRGPMRFHAKALPNASAWWDTAPVPSPWRGESCGEAAQLQGRPVQWVPCEARVGFLVGPQRSIGQRNPKGQINH